MGTLLASVTLFLTAIFAGSGCAFFIEKNDAARAVILAVFTMLAVVSLIALIREKQ